MRKFYVVVHWQRPLCHNPATIIETDLHLKILEKYFAQSIPSCLPTEVFFRAAGLFLFSPTNQC